MKAVTTEQIRQLDQRAIAAGRTGEELMERAGVTFNERGAPHHNTETFETTVPNLFVAGGAIAGEDTGTVFIENGRFHGAKIIDVIAARCARD